MVLANAELFIKIINGRLKFYRLVVIGQFQLQVVSLLIRKLVTKHIIFQSLNVLNILNVAIDNLFLLLALGLQQFLGLYDGLVGLGIFYPHIFFKRRFVALAASCEDAFSFFAFFGRLTSFCWLFFLRF